MSEAKRCPVCRGRGALRCDCWPGDCICGWDDEPCDNCCGNGWLDDQDEYYGAIGDAEWAAMAAAMHHKASPGHLPDFDRLPQRNAGAKAIKPDKRAKVKAARAQNVRRKRK